MNFWEAMKALVGGEVVENESGVMYWVSEDDIPGLRFFKRGYSVDVDYFATALAGERFSIVTDPLERRATLAKL